MAALSKRSAASSYLEPNNPQPLSFFSAFFSNSSARPNWSDIILSSLKLDRIFSVFVSSVALEEKRRRFIKGLRLDKVHGNLFCKEKNGNILFHVFFFFFWGKCILFHPLRNLLIWVVPGIMKYISLSINPLVLQIYAILQIDLQKFCLNSSESFLIFSFLFKISLPIISVD